MWPTQPTTVLMDRLTQLNAYYYKGTPDWSLLQLYQNDVTPDANSTVDQFEEATFPGYAQVQLTMSAVSLNSENIPVSQSNLCHFQPTDDTLANTIYGIYITDSDGALIVAERFDTPITLDGPSKAINGVWRVSEPSSNYGWLSVE